MTLTNTINSVYRQFPKNLRDFGRMFPNDEAFVAYLIGRNKDSILI